jgi:hypothetical protein
MQEFWWDEWEIKNKIIIRCYSWITTWFSSSDYNTLTLDMFHNIIKTRATYNYKKNTT